MNDITIVTPHRDRTRQLELVVDCINNQTVKPDKWIIVDDGLEKVPDAVLAKSSVPIQYIWYERKYQKSSSENSLIAIQRVTTNKCIIIEDDDYYPPHYIETVSNLLQDKKDVFLGNLSWYIYRLSTGHYTIRKGKQMKPHCGVEFEWHSAAFVGQKIRQALITVFTAHKGRNLPPDVLAQALINTGKFALLLPDLKSNSCVSLKDYGVGHPGWMSDHRRVRKDTKEDKQDFQVFKEWLGEDWVRYKEFLGRDRKK